MPQHRVDGRRPLILEARRQLRDGLRSRRRIPPHLLLLRLGSCKAPDKATVSLALDPVTPLKHNKAKKRWGGGNPLIPHLPQRQPRHIPAPPRSRVPLNPYPRLVHNVRAERVAPRQPAQLDEELVAGDVVGPGRGEGRAEGGCVKGGRGGCYALDADEVC